MTKKSEMDFSLNVFDPRFYKKPDRKFIQFAQTINKFMPFVMQTSLFPWKFWTLTMHIMETTLKKSQYNEKQKPWIESFCYKHNNADNKGAKSPFMTFDISKFVNAIMDL